MRWATPVSAFQRTANEDTELAACRSKKGQRVVMSYRSANFDEEVFEDPHTFNILRDPNPHVGFGGTGAHYCIGANLARMTINLIFNAVADHMPDLKPDRRAGAATVGVAERNQALAGGLHRRRRAGEKRRVPGRPLVGSRLEEESGGFHTGPGTAGCRRRRDVGAGPGQQLGRTGCGRRDGAGRARNASVVTASDCPRSRRR